MDSFYLHWKIVNLNVTFVVNVILNFYTDSRIPKRQKIDVWNTEHLPCLSTFVREWRTPNIFTANRDVAKCSGLGVNLSRSFWQFPNGVLYGSMNFFTKPFYSLVFVWHSIKISSLRGKKNPSLICLVQISKAVLCLSSSL